MVFQHFHFLAHQARPYMHHTCHLMHRGSFVLFLLLFCSVFHQKLPRLTRLLFWLGVSWPSWPFKKSFKNKWFFNISAFWPHQARTYTHHTCRLMSRSSFSLFLLLVCSLFHQTIIFSPTFFHSWSVLAPLALSKKHLKNQLFFNIFTFGPPSPNIYASYLQSHA